MGRHVGLKVSWIPKFTHKLAEPLHEQEHDVAGWPADSPVVLLLQEIVPQGRDIGEGLREWFEVVNFQCHGQVYKMMFRSDLYLQHNVGVVISLDVIEADNSRQVGGPIVRSVQFALLIQPCNMLLCERWLQHILQGESDKCQLAHVSSLCWHLTFIGEQHGP